MGSTNVLCWFHASFVVSTSELTAVFVSTYIYLHIHRDALLQGGFGAAVLGLAVGGVVAAPVRPAQAFPFGGGDDVGSGLDDIAKARARVEEGECFGWGWGYCVAGLAAVRRPTSTL